jgi:hypothetical protein
VADSFTSSYSLVLQITGSNSGTWGTDLNNNMISPVDTILGGTQSVVMTNADVTLSIPQWQNKAFKITGALVGNLNLILPLSPNAIGGTPGVGGEFIVDNRTTGNFTITVKTAASGSTGVVAQQGFRNLLYSDTVNVLRADDIAPALLVSPFNTTVLAALGFQADQSIMIDGGGNVLQTGAGKFTHVPFACTINNWSVMADVSGSVVVDVLRANSAVPSSSMVGGGNKPTLSSSQFSGNVAPSGWTSTAFAKDDWIGWSVISATTVTRITAVLNCTRTGF